MIEFKHPLPALRCEGHECGTFNNWDLANPCIMSTQSANLGKFLRGLHNIVQENRRFIFVEGRPIVCCHNWIRDHVHIMKAFKHWEYELKAFVDFIIGTQTDEGFFMELVKQMDDGHWRMVGDDCRRLLPEDHVALVRLELEADVEYLVVEGAWYYYQASGDLEWIRRVLPSLEKAIDYITSHPKRWSEKYGLAIRPLTIDTWDFVNSPTTGGDRTIHEDERMGAMHGDNSGLFQAMQQLAIFNEKLGDGAKAASWRARAEDLRQNMMKHLWNGTFFVHQLPIDCEPDDDKEPIRLSLSNTYAINRGVTNREESRAIIGEYQARRKTTQAFAEWFSIDPPYEKFAHYLPGQYVNGAISPFTAGELAKAAFENGEEAYGWDILARFTELFERDGTVHFLYDTKTAAPWTTSYTGPSAWGAAALLSAIDEGLAGIRDADCLYRELNFAPRFAVTPHKEVKYFTGYELTQRFVQLHYICTDDGIRCDLRTPSEKINAHILLPAGTMPARVLVNGTEVPFAAVKVQDSVYADFTVEGIAVCTMEVLFA